MVLHRNNNKKVDVENHYWISFSDLMSGLLLIFMLATAVLILELTEKKSKVNEAIQELADADSVRTVVLKEVELNLQKLGIKVIVDSNGTLLRIPESTLAFKSNSDEIPKNSIKILKIIGNELHASLLADNRIEYFNTIFVEGHTDSDRCFLAKGNWGLSTYRAINVWKFWNKYNNFAKLKNYSGQSLFSVSGYGATRRVNEIEKTSEDKKANRRIDIRFTVKNPSLQDLYDVREVF